jgi:hypothetical protein
MDGRFSTAQRGTGWFDAGTGIAATTDPSTYFNMESFFFVGLGGGSSPPAWYWQGFLRAYRKARNYGLGL